MTLIFNEQRNRTEFVLLRKNEFANAFMGKLFDLFAKDVRLPIDEILQNNRRLLDVLSIHILKLQQRSFNPELFYQISQFSKGHMLLQELHHELDLKRAIDATLVKGSADVGRVTGTRVLLNRTFQGARQVINLSCVLQLLARAIDSHAANDSILINVFLDIDPSINLIICDEKALIMCCSNALNRACKLIHRIGAQRLIRGMVNRTYHVTMSVKHMNTKGKVLKFNDDRLLLFEVFSSALLEFEEFLAKERNETRREESDEGGQANRQGTVPNHRAPRLSDSFLKSTFGDHICKGVVLNLHRDAIFDCFPEIQDGAKILEQTAQAAVGDQSCAISPICEQRPFVRRSNSHLMQRFTLPYTQHPER